MTDWHIRTLEGDETPFLREMLYTALYVHEGEDPFPPNTVDQPVWRKWYEDWGKSRDLAFVAQTTEGLGGACWSRLFSSDNPGYGYVADDIPELTIALKEEYRGVGIGTALLQKMIDAVSARGHRGLSLSIDGRNVGARRLYERHGFRIVKDGVNPTMMVSF